MDNLVKLLSDLVSIDSGFPRETKLGHFLEQYLRNAGFVVEKQSIGESRFNLLAKRGSGEKAIGFYGHLDTVPTHAADWQTPPLKLTARGDKLIGHGAYDMKGGIAAFLEAIKDSNRYIKIVLAADEENISQGAWAAVQENPGFFKDIELVISAEPNFGTGIAAVTRGRTGRVVFEINFEGKPVHIAQYREGIDAVELMGQFISNFYAKREKLFKSPQTVGLIRKVEAASTGMSVCGEARLEVEVFLGTEDSIKSVQSKLQSLTKSKVELKPRATPYLEGYFFDRFPHQDQIAKIIEDQTGQKIKLVTRSSVGDDNVFASLGIPIITWGPDGDNAHSANEFVSKKSLETMAKMYKLLVN